MDPRIAGLHELIGVDVVWCWRFYVFVDLRVYTLAYVGAFRVCLLDRDPANKHGMRQHTLEYIRGDPRTRRIANNWSVESIAL